MSHSDYYYCPESKTEKNLNDQIMKYLNENNLNYKKKPLKLKKASNIFSFNNKNLEINGNTKENLNENKIFQIIVDNNSEQNKFLNNDKSNNKEQILYTDILNYNIEKYLEQMKKCNNFNAQINQINNIKIKNIFITHKENINKREKIRGVKKVKENFNNLKTEKIITRKDKLNNKNSKNNNVVKIKNSKNKKKNKINKKNFSMDYNNKSREKQNNIKNEKKQKFEISHNKINEKTICDKKEDNKKNISRLSNISLQSMNDSKLMLLADDIISKEENFDKFNLNNNRFQNK